MLGYFANKKLMSRYLYFMMVLCLGVIQTNAQDKLKNEKEVVVQTYINSKWIPDSMFNLRIVAGKKIEVISLNSREMDLSTNNYRQIGRAHV